jgi:large subunit ribosomal protein L7/L12
MADKKDTSKKEAPQAEDKKEEKKVTVPSKFKELVEQIEKMSVLELSELVKVLEDKFGVSGAMAVAPAAGVGAQNGNGQAEEKSTVDLVLESAGASKIQVIKAIKEITGKGLKEAKELVDGAPQTVKDSLNPEEAEEIKKKLEEAGATVKMK